MIINGAVQQTSLVLLLWHCCAREEPALSFQPDSVSCHRAQLSWSCWGLSESNKRETKQSEGPALALQLHHRPVSHEVSPALHRLVLLSTHLDGDACRIWATESWEAESHGLTKHLLELLPCRVSQ